MHSRYYATTRIYGRRSELRICRYFALTTGGSLSLDGMATATAAAPHAKGRQADEGTYSNDAVQCRFRAAGSFCNSLQHTKEHTLLEMLSYQDAYTYIIPSRDRLPPVYSRKKATRSVFATQLATH